MVAPVLAPFITIVLSLFQSVLVNNARICFNDAVVPPYACVDVLPKVVPGRAASFGSVAHKKLRVCLDQNVW